VLRTRLGAVPPSSGVLSDKCEFLACCERPEAGGKVVSGVVQTGCGAEFHAGWRKTITGRGSRQADTRGGVQAARRRRRGGGPGRARRRGGAAPPGRRPALAQSALSMTWASWALPTAPIWVACTWPSLNSSSIGIERTWYFSAVARFSSTLTLAIFTLP